MEELKLELLRKIKDAPNIYMKKKYLLELKKLKKSKSWSKDITDTELGQDLKKMLDNLGKRTKLLGSSKVVVVDGKPVIK